MCAGVKDGRSPFEGEFFDGDYEHGDLFKLIGVDHLHHWKLGVQKRLVGMQIKVLNHLPRVLFGMIHSGIVLDNVSVPSSAKRIRPIWDTRDQHAKCSRDTR
jgi:hypothetical protein